ncbi:hypothetical protein F0L68_30270 [Solihabitans fulvus]|uniref:Macro domain-containing protein n=1 Tax=Solihabitans fulvus TaxID=1892852 RepID=A0A5B2WUC5_9PSEU|nr:P-loop NTPase fold protein [Solihabitans fulvus]KAA2254470.1 hypothetical protein F0L68_30270 [Solihabitans fulvus]
MALRDNGEHSTEEFAYTALGRIGRIQYGIGLTDEPWRLDIDVIVLSVGGTLGVLGSAVRAQFPQAAWDAIPYGSITADNPRLLDLLAPDSAGDESADQRLRAVLVSPHATGDDLDPVDLRSIGRATAAAVRSAADLGARSVGMPIIGTGALGFSMAETADAAVAAAIGASAEVPERSQLRRLVFVCRDQEDAAAIHASWSRAKLAVPPSELAGGVSSDLVDPNTGIPLARDQLDLAPYVSMLATVIADSRTPTPLSVGVFGEWGSGKSYFMGLLRGQVDALTTSGNAGYCADVVQIGFNAWHYADSNIWASLGDEIFRQLAGPHPTAQDRRSQLRAELAKRLDQRKEFEAATQQAKTTAAELQAELNDAAAHQRLSARDLVTVLRASPEFAATLDALWRRLGLRSEAEQGALLAEQIRGVVGEAAALRRLPRDRLGRTTLAAALVILLTGVLAVALAPSAREWLSGVAALFALVSGTGLTMLVRARSALRSLRAIAEQLRVGAASTSAARITPDIAEKLRALHEAEADQLVTEAQLTEVTSHIGELGRELTELMPGRRLYTFLANRARGDSYTRDLGLVSTIRKDFEELVALMADWRANPEVGDQHRVAVDRIVLYVDDLDRCGPRQVVEVLQAVNLLLALDLFIVVVGVDPRWLLRSLHSHYADVLDDGSADSDPAGDGLRVTPEDYLEKIINIPVVLPGMHSGSLHRLLRAMAEDTATPQAAAAPDPPEPGADRPSGRGADIESLSSLPIEGGSEIAGQRRQGGGPEAPHPLTEPELSLLSALDLLVDTPRKAKRLFNLYRMVRATRDLAPASRFLGDDGRPGEYEAVAVLLGLLTAHARLLAHTVDSAPDPANAVDGGLAHRSGDSSWPEFVADFEPRRHDRGWANGIAGTLPERDVAEWSRLHRGLVRASERVTMTTVTDLQTWVPRIRRFSYALAPRP